MDGILRELARLVSTRPTLESSDTEIAAWYEDKARLLTTMAAEPGLSDGEVERVLAQSRAAVRHAALLRRPATDQDIPSIPTGPDSPEPLSGAA